MAYPTTLALITALWSGPGRTKSIALWSALGGGIALLGPLISGALARALRLGLGLPRHAAARRDRAADGDLLRPEPRQRGNRAGRQPRGRSLGGARRRADRLDQLPARPEREDGRARAARGRGRRRDPLLPPPAARGQSALRPPHRRPPDLLGRRLRGDHRLRLADGRRLHQPAVPAERARLLDAPGGRRDPPRRPLHGARRAALGQARRAARVAADAAHRAGVPLPRLPADAAVLEGGHPVLAGRDPVHASSGSGWASRARRPRTRSRDRCP